MSEEDSNPTIDTSFPDSESGEPLGETPQAVCGVLQANFDLYRWVPRQGRMLDYDPPWHIDVEPEIDSGTWEVVVVLHHASGVVTYKYLGDFLFEYRPEEKKHEATIQ